MSLHLKIHSVLFEILQFKLEPISLNKCHKASVHNGIKDTISNGSECENLHSLNLSISFDDQYQKVNTNSQHYDRKGKYSQKRTRESTILKSKVHLVTSGSRVWPVTIFFLIQCSFNVIRHHHGWTDGTSGPLESRVNRENLTSTSNSTIRGDLRRSAVNTTCHKVILRTFCARGNIDQFLFCACSCKRIKMADREKSQEKKTKRLQSYARLLHGGYLLGLTGQYFV